MKKVSVLLLIIVSLITASFVGVGVPRASAATVTATATPSTVNVVTALSITVLTSAVTENVIVISLPSFQLPAVSTMLSGVTINTGGGVVTATAYVSAANQITIISPADLTAGYALVAFSTAAGIKTPLNNGTYPVTCAVGSDTGSANIVIGGGSSVISPTVQVSSTAPSAVASYTVAFSTSANGALVSGNTITIQFPSTTTFSSPSGTVQVYAGGSTYGYGTYVVSGYTMTVTIYTSIAASTWVQLVFPSITNPSTTGTYHLTVWTSADTTPVQSNPYYITGTSITGLSLTVDPKAQSTAAQFTITFTTSATGALAANSGTILIDFPSTVILPSSISSGLITVNGTPAYYASVTSNNAISITTPVSIAAYQQVSVVLPKTLGITNPSSSGVTVTVAVSTSADVAAVSTSYTTITSQITQPQVQLTSYGAGSVSEYRISFNTGVAGSLRANYDTITIIFPTSTVLPNTISRDLVKVNNYPAYSVTTAGNRLTIIPGVSAAANASIQIVIDKAAGIKNPSNAGSFTLQAYTSIETTSVTSAVYTIVNLPRTLMTISPASPDGLNGYYKTRPTVVLSASSPVSSALTTYYSINGAAQQIYTAPFQLPDGNVTLTYYSRDQQGNQEDVQTFTAKVDATAPTATIVSPAQGAVVGASPVTVVGKVSPGMQVSVAGSSVTVSATGDFTTSVALKEGPQTITFTVTSVSGNVGQAQLAITLDTTPPVLTITKPIMYATVLTSVCEVSGKTEPGATVKVAGSAVTVNTDGSFSSNVMLKEGDNLIDITATDAVGNQRKTAIPVTYKARTVIHLQVGNKTAMVNDTKNTLQVAPVIRSGNTMVPLRFIGEAFGATVTWDPVFQIIDISLKGSSIRLQVGTNYASIGGKKVIFQGVPVIISGTTMVPIRFISEAFGAQVDWTAATQGIDITYPKP